MIEFSERAKSPFYPVFNDSNFALLEYDLFKRILIDKKNELYFLFCSRFLKSDSKKIKLLIDDIDYIYILKKDLMPLCKISLYSPELEKITSSHYQLNYYDYKTSCDGLKTHLIEFNNKLDTRHLNYNKIKGIAKDVYQGKFKIIGDGEGSCQIDSAYKSKPFWEVE